ncbi:hypothetical protein [Paludibacterium yongneupense]|uniref:hypothetical protein n=1 Tax=Paludibacterium yongneupense TaxID=400061 RepID=UPI00041EDC01|nr:hypothetical protein [Paludibacterium yongneupense]
MSATAAQTQMQALSELHQLLLPQTLANALKTPFYQRHWSGIDTAAIGPGGLAHLPLTDKTMIRQAGRDAQNRLGDTCHETFTSDASGIPFVTVRSVREQAFLHEFFARQRPAGQGENLPRAIRFKNIDQGHLSALPAAMHAHELGLYDHGVFSYARTLLGSRLEDQGVESRVTLLIGLERMLRAFTADCENHVRPSHTLHSIVSYSHYLTPAWRRRHETFWGCQVNDRFTPGEVFGGASRDNASGWWHWDPQLIPEVIGAHSGQVLREGVGLLALTALYPFQQAQPLVRYLTGDLVAVTHSLPGQEGRFAFQPLGRSRAGIRQPGSDDWLITPAALFEIMDELPSVARLPRFLDSPDVRDPYAIGHPRYQLQGRECAGRTEISIAWQASPRLQDAPSQAALIIDRLVAACPRLADALERGEAVISSQARARIGADLIAHAE